MKIAIVLPDLRGGGVERIRLVLAKEFFRAGHTVEFLLMQARGELLDEAKQMFSVVDLKCPRARKLPLSLARYLRQRRPDALLVGMWSLTVLAPFAVLLSRHSCRVIVSEHNSLSIQYGAWGWAHRIALRISMSIGYRLADAKVGVSEGVVNDIARLSALNRDAFTLIHNPVPPPENPDYNDLRRVENLWESTIGARIVTVGSLKTQKNHRLLLHAFAKLDRGNKRLMLVGDGPGRHDLQRLAEKLSIAEQVIFTGFQHDPTPFYMTADLFVLSSDYEGFGNVIVEALSCGTPVVSTDCPSGPAEILENGRWGLLTPVGDAVALAEAMNEGLNTSWDTELLRQRASHFSPDVAARKYLELFDPL